MKRSLLVPIFTLGLAVLGGAIPALAHGVPARHDERPIAGYRLQINQYAAPARVAQALQVTVSADGASLDGVVLTIRGRPGLGTDANPTRAVPLIEEPLEPGSYAAEVVLPVAGTWDLEVQVDGPAGTGAVRVPVTVAAPAAMPVWLGWLIGLSPLAGLAWFARWTLRQSPRDDAPAATMTAQPAAAGTGQDSLTQPRAIRWGDPQAKSHR
jgi:hypothetical protein